MSKQICLMGLPYCLLYREKIKDTFVGCNPEQFASEKEAMDAWVSIYKKNGFLSKGKWINAISGFVTKVISPVIIDEQAVIVEKDQS